jgi:hypothetical protein
MRVEAINRAGRIALISDGRCVPATNWFDITGEECEPEDAVSCVAGEGDDWFSVLLSEYETARTQ